MAFASVSCSSSSSRGKQTIQAGLDRILRHGMGLPMTWNGWASQQGTLWPRPDNRATYAAFLKLSGCDVCFWLAKVEMLATKATAADLHSALPNGPVIPEHVIQDASLDL
eukprot:1160650-Pelagomonas_calceolata.AAC.5